MSVERPAGRPDPGRLVDLHVAWLRQYAGETELFEPSVAERVRPGIGQVEGYLGGTGAAIVWISLDEVNRTRFPNARNALAEQIARIEAEFSGRLLANRDDHARWRMDDGGLCWAVPGIQGLSALPDEGVGLAGLEPFVERGVRAFGWAANPRDSVEDAHPRLIRLCEWLADQGAVHGMRPLLDLSGADAAADLVLSWLEANPGRVVPIISRAGLDDLGPGGVVSIEGGRLARIAARGGVVGFVPSQPWFQTEQEMRTAIEHASQSLRSQAGGNETVGLASSYLDNEAVLPGLETVEALTNWAGQSFDEATGTALVAGSGRRLIARMLRLGDDSAP